MFAIGRYGARVAFRSVIKAKLPSKRHKIGVQGVGKAVRHRGINFGMDIGRRLGRRNNSEAIGYAVSVGVNRNHISTKRIH